MESIDLLLVERFGTLSPLGSGGMGEVFRGIDPGLGRPVAIKRMRQPSLAMRERLRREAKILERLQHPNVCPLLEWHEVDDSAWMVMPVIEGESLSIVAKQLAIAEIAPLFEQICRGIEAAHALGLIHRDIKPSNILVDRVGGHWHPWIMDFGIARSQEEQTLTGSHEVMGTPGYMAPEQARGDSHEVDQRSDVFGIGATLFYALTLEPPFGRGTLAEVLARVLEQDAPSPRDLRPETPDALGRIVLRCLERDPARRYPDVAALRNDLECFRTGERVHAPSNGPWFYAQRAWRRHPRFWAGVFAMGWVATLALGYAVYSELSSAARAVQMSQTAALAERVRATMHSALLAPMHDIGADRERLGVQISTLLAMPEPNDPELRRQHLRALRDAYADIEDGDSALVFARRLARSAGVEDVDRLRYIEVAIDRFRDAVRPFQSLPKDLRDDYSTDARKRILEPALALGRSLSLPAPIAARLAAIDGDLDTAQKLAESLPRVRSDDTSVLQLRAEIAGAQSQVAFDQGAVDQAVALIDAADQFLQSAIAIHRSDAVLMQHACALATRRLSMLAARAAEAPDDPAALSRYCGDAVQADPRAAGTLEVLAMAWLTIAAAHDVRGESDAARVAFARSSAVISPSLADAAVRVESRLLFARAELGLGRLNLHIPERAEPHYDRCIAELQRLVTTTPAYLPGLISLGEAHRDRGRFFANYKRDVEPDYAEAERNLRRAVALNPDSVLAHEALSKTLLFRFYEARDEDFERATGFAKAAIAAQEQVLAKQPDRPDALFNQAANLGDLWTYLADRAAPSEISTTLPTLLQALQLFERVRELAPQRPDTYEFEIGFRAQAGENLRIAGQPRIDLLKPVPLLIDAAAANKVRLNESYVAWALTELAQALAETGAVEATRVFDQARASLDHTLAVADERHDAMRMGLAWATLRARWAMTRKETPTPWLAFGEQLLREALATERGKGDNIIACDGAALLAQKALYGTTTMRIDAAEQGLALFRQCETLSARYFQRYRSTADQLELQLATLSKVGE